MARRCFWPPLEGVDRPALEPLARTTWQGGGPSGSAVGVDRGLRAASSCSRWAQLGNSSGDRRFWTTKAPDGAMDVA